MWSFPHLRINKADFVQMKVEKKICQQVRQLEYVDPITNERLVLQPLSHVKLISRTMVKKPYRANDL